MSLRWAGFNPGTLSFRSSVLLSAIVGFEITFGSSVHSDPLLNLKLYNPVTKKDFVLGKLSIEANGQIDYYSQQGGVFISTHLIAGTDDVVYHNTRHFVVVEVLPFGSSSTVKIWIDNVLAAAETGDTGNGPGGLGELSWTAPFGSTVGLAYVLDHTGSAPLNAPILDLAGVDLNPDEDVLAEWIPKTPNGLNFEEIDEGVGNSDGDGSYVSAWGKHIDEVGVDGPVVAFDSILAVFARAKARSEAASIETKVAIDVVSGGNIRYGNYINPPVTYDNVSVAAEVDPNTGLAWVDLDTVKASDIRYRNDDFGTGGGGSAGVSAIGPIDFRIDLPTLYAYLSLDPIDFVFQVLDISIGYIPPSGGGGGFEGLIFTDTFESYMTGSHIPNGSGANGFLWNLPAEGHGATISVETDPQGDQALRFAFVTSVAGQDEKAEQYFTLAPDALTAPTTIGIEFDLYVPPNFNTAYENRADRPNNNKFLATWAENYNRSAGDASMVLEYQYVSSLGYTHFRAARVSGTDAPGTHDPSGFTTVKDPIFTAAQRGNWVNIKIIEILVDAIASGDRNCAIWLDDTLVFEVRGMKSSSPLNYLRRGYLFGWSNSGFDANMDFYVDNWKYYNTDPGW